MTTPRPNAPPPSHRPADNGSTSRSLLAAARLDRSAAWSRLMDLYAPLVAAWCARWGVARQDIMDVVQEVFTAVARNLEHFRKEQPHDTFRGWLATIARNKVHDYFRARGKTPAAAGGTEAWRRISQVCDANCLATESSDGDAEILNEVLQRALDSIRSEFHERTWEAFWKTVVDGQPATDVAAELKMQPGAVRVAKSRILCRLRSALGDEPLAQ